MENVNLPDHWHDLYVMLGTSAAALFGLLLVVTSLHLDEIVENPAYRARARSNSIFLIIMIVEAALILTPQPMTLLGLELAAISLFGWSFPVRNSYRFYYKELALGKRGGMAPMRALSFHGAFLIGVAGGVGLFESFNWGIYLATASYVTLIASVSLNAWSIMLGIGQAEGKTKARSKKRAA
jgi:hypothetical protein